MNIEEYRKFCLGLKGTTEGFPFDDKTLVFYVQKKMFALTDINAFKSINLKCDPELAIELRERYPSIKPGYHMNKKHWNTIEMDDSMSIEFIEKMIKNSYDLVVAKMPKKLRKELE